MENCEFDTLSDQYLEMTVCISELIRVVAFLCFPVTLKSNVGNNFAHSSQGVQ